MRKTTLALLAVLGMWAATQQAATQQDLAAAWDEPAQVVEMPLWDGFPRRQAPGTGRAAVQLTSGDEFCYPLYYFIPSFTAYAKYLIYYRARPPAGGVQLYRLNLRSGESVRLSRGTAPRNQWRPWCTEKGGGVLDHRSVLNVARNELIYLDGNDVRLVHVETLEDKLLFTLPEDREAIGQNTVTPNGEWLVYIDAPAGVTGGQPAPGVKLVAYHFDTGEERVLTNIDFGIHHVTAYDNQHVVFCHNPETRMGMMMASLSGDGGYDVLHTHDPGVLGHACHHVMTRRGIAYETVRGNHHSGLYDPLTRRRFEFRLPPGIGYVHTGWDPQGRLWFYECTGGGHRMIALVRLCEDGSDEWLELTGDWPTYNRGQFSHFHPQLTPDRQWILFTGGDPATETNHLFLLDATDLREVREISRDKLSPTGEHCLTRVRLPKELAVGALPVKEATASGFESPHGPENTIDGNLETLWAAEGEGQWIRYDLGEVQPVGRIFIAWHAGDQRRQRLQIVVSEDGGRWEVVFDGLSSGTARGPEPVDIRPFRARYVRIVGNGNTANRWNSMRQMVILAPTEND